MSNTRELIAKLNEIATDLDRIKATGGFVQQPLFAARLLASIRPCYVCGYDGPGMVELADGRRVHRWPCRDRMAL